MLAAIVCLCFLLQGCALNQPLVPPEEAAMSVAQKCQVKCLSTMRSGADMSVGPCIGLIEKDWVCDSVHSPRQAEDDLPENQCPDFREGRAHHFVEVTQECKLVRVV
jgi:hypothetical protein